jgi:hypothetical protein
VSRDTTGSTAESGADAAGVPEGDCTARGTPAELKGRAASSVDRDSTNIAAPNSRIMPATIAKISVPPPMRWSQGGRSSGFRHATRGASQRRQRSRLALIRVPHEAQMTNPISSSSSNIEE